MPRPRQQRQPPLPDVPRASVPDASTQLAITAIITALQAVIEFLRPYKQPEPWYYLPFESGWTDTTVTTLARCQFRKDAMGYVSLRGWALASGASTTIAVLPVGKRPALRLSFACPAYAGSNQYGRVDVVEDGRVILVTPAAAAAVEVSLSNIRFSTEA